MTGEDRETEFMDALERQFRHARSPLVAWFRRRVGDSVEAEDLCQECFLRIRNRGVAGQIENVDGYLYQTARSVLADRRRRRAARDADAHSPFDPERDASREPDPLRHLLAREELARVSGLLDGMPERTRSAFVLCRFEGQRYTEIAARLGISVSAVQKHMLRAIEILLSAGDEE